MFLRVKDGYYAGQVREFPAAVAHELLRQNRAVNPFDEIEDALEERKIPKLAAPPAQTSRRKSRG